MCCQSRGIYTQGEKQMAYGKTPSGKGKQFNSLYGPAEMSASRKDSMKKPVAKSKVKSTKKVSK